jgi:hypothetical protein
MHLGSGARSRTTIALRGSHFGARASTTLSNTVRSIAVVAIVARAVLIFVSVMFMSLVWLAASSRAKGEADRNKYEKARKLARLIG